MRSAPLIPAQTLLSLLLVALTLAPSLMGRAGFQLIEEAVAARCTAMACPVRMRTSGNTASPHPLCILIAITRRAILRSTPRPS
jgi:hypothetical protein